MAQSKAAVKATASKVKTAAKEVEVKAVETVGTAETAGTVGVAETATKKTTTKKAPAKKTETKAETKAETKTKTTAKKATKAEEVKAVVNFQFAGKSYTTEDLVKIAKDVWVYDLNKDLADFKTVELYVKPEESTAYYVVNEEVTGCFVI